MLIFIFVSHKEKPMMQFFRTNAIPGIHNYSNMWPH